MKKIYKIAIPIVLVICIGVWSMSFVKANHSKIIIKDEIYAMGVPVNIGENYYINIRENPNGYVATVNSARVLATTDFFVERGKDESYIPEIDEYGNRRPDYIYEVNMTVENIDNDEGVFFYFNLMLFYKSLALSIETPYMALINEELAENAAFTLKKGSKKDFTFVFVPDGWAATNNPKKVNEMMLNDDFYLCLSWYPKRVLIKLEA